MSRTGWRWLAGLALAALMVTGCTGGNDDKDTAAPEKPTTSLPPECKGISVEDPAAAEAGDEPETTTTLPADCADAVFVALVGEQGSKELSGADKDQLLGFGHGMCAYAQALAADPANAPTYDELVSSTATSWGVSEKSVEEVLGFAATLCPGELDPILKLRDDVGEVTVQMTVTGANPVQVTYTMPDGGDFQDTIEAPWEHEVILESASDFSLTVGSPEGEVTCAVAVKGEELSKETADKGAEATCAATSAELRDAAR